MDSLQLSLMERSMMLKTGQSKPDTLSLSIIIFGLKKISKSLGEINSLCWQALFCRVRHDLANKQQKTVLSRIYIQIWVGVCCSYWMALFQDIIHFISCMENFILLCSLARANWWGRERTSLVVVIGGCLVTKSHPTLVTPWTVAHQREILILRSYGWREIKSKLKLKNQKWKI